MKKLILTLLFGALILAVSAQVPKTLSFQGYLTDAAGEPVTSSPDMTFYLFDALSGGTQLWTEIHSAVPVTKGLYNVLLGDAGTPVNLPFDKVYYLQIKVGTETLAPRITISSSAYSLSSINASTITNGVLGGALVGTGINATNITTGSVANSLLDADLQDLADGSLSGASIGSGINASNITSGTIADTRLESTVDLTSLNVGSAQFAVSNTGNITKINNIAYSFPAAQGAANSFLSNNSSGTLAWATSLPGSQVGTGISASNITSGTLTGSLVGSGVNATNITGTLAGSQVGTGINASNITTGTLTGTLVGAGVDGTDITTGTLADARLEATIDRTAFNATSNVTAGGYVTAATGLHVGSSGAPAASNLEVDGFTKLGAAVPAGADASATVPVIKHVKLSGTTSANSAGSTGLNHGLAGAKILSVSVLVQYSAGNFIGPNFIISGGYYYNFYITPTQIVVVNIDNANPLFSSTSVRGKSFVVYITYEQ